MQTITDIKYILQPRTQEILHFLGVLDDVHSLALDLKQRCEYKMPGGVEVLRVMEVAPKQQPTPSKPYVRLPELMLESMTIH